MARLTELRCSKRAFLGMVAGTLGTALALAACGGEAASAPTAAPSAPGQASATAAGKAAAPTSAPAPAPTTAPAAALAKPSTAAVALTYWHSWTEQWEEMTKFVCDSFHQKYPNMTATETVIPGNELITKLLSAVAAGAPPDTITIYSAINIPSLVEQGAILSLNDYAGPNDLTQAKDWFHPAVLNIDTYKGKIWALSYWQQTSCVGWNKRIFKEAGLDTEKPPASTDELDSLAQKLTKVDGGQIVRMGAMPTDYWTWAAVWGGKFYDEANQKVTANDPRIVEMFTWMASYSKRYDVTKVQAFQQGLASERAGTLDPFVAGKFAIAEIGGAWKLGDFKKYAPPEGFDYGIAAAPDPANQTGIATYSYGDNTVVPKGTKHPVEAWQFVKYTGGLGGTVEDYFKVLTWGSRPVNVPVTMKVLDYPPMQQIVKDYPGFQQMIDMFFKGDRVGFPPKMPVGTFYADRLGAARDKIRLLQVEPKAAMDDVTQQVQKELDDFFAKQKKG